jgi:hypothetical protein
MARMPYRSQVVMQGFGVRLPQTLVEQVDALRGDVNRSRYIQRLIEKNMNAIRSESVLGGASTHPISSTKGKRDLSPNG